MPTTTLHIPGLHCASCVNLVKDVSGAFQGITTVNVDLSAKKVTLEHSDIFDLQKWTEEIESLGDAYRVTIL